MPLTFYIATAMRGVLLMNYLDNFIDLGSSEGFQLNKYHGLSARWKYQMNNLKNYMNIHFIFTIWFNSTQQGVPLQSFMSLILNTVEGNETDFPLHSFTLLLQKLR